MEIFWLKMATFLQKFGIFEWKNATFSPKISIFLSKFAAVFHKVDVFWLKIRIFFFLAKERHFEENRAIFRDTDEKHADFLAKKIAAFDREIVTWSE